MTLAEQDNYTQIANAVQERFEELLDRARVAEARVAVLEAALRPVVEERSPERRHHLTGHLIRVDTGYTGGTSDVRHCLSVAGAREAGRALACSNRRAKAGPYEPTRSN